MTRTYSRSEWQAADAAWLTFTGSVWMQVRRACSRWTLYPPSSQGGEYRDEPQPSQRTIVWAALDARPQETLQLIWAGPSWRAVVGWILETEDNLMADALEREREAERYKPGREKQAQEFMAELHRRFGGAA